MQDNKAVAIECWENMMPRTGYRARLENGLKLDINRLARRGFIRPGAATGPVGRGTLATGTITADISGENGPHG